MTIEGVDYSDSRPSPHGLVNVGKQFAGRYVGAGSGAKLLQVDEAQSLSDAGLLIVSLVEGAETDPLGGYDVGVAHGHGAVNWHTARGFPTDVVWYFGVDFDVTEQQWPAVAEYLRGAASVVGIGRTGVYGSIRAMEWAKRDGVAAWFMQTYAWSNGAWSGFNTIEQYRNGVSLVGGEVDLDRALTDHYGGWSMTAQPAAPVDESTAINQIHWSVGRGAPTQPGHEPAGNEAMTYWAGHVTDRLVAIQDALDALKAAEPSQGAPMDPAPILGALQAVQAAVDALSQAPAVDAVAVAKAIAASPDVVEHLAAAIVGKLAAIDGEMTLSGTMTAGIKPQAT